MAGVKGRSGGARPGAGRKKKAPIVLAPVPAKPAARKKTAPPAAAPKVPASPLEGIGQEGFDPRPALEQVAKGLIEVSPQQFKALTALLPYVHTKKGDGGVKDERADKAKRVAGKFGAAPPPLALVKR